jgi:hypothetical protein
MQNNTNPATLSSRLDESDMRAVSNPVRANGCASNTDIYEELAQLSRLLPERYREVFCFRWGLNGQFPHITSQVATKFEIPKGTAEDMVVRCTWNLARHSHSLRLPAIRALLGDNRELWAERAWEHSARVWGNQGAQFSETALLLALGGLDVPSAYQAARQHMIKLGLGRSNKWGNPATREQRAAAARAQIDRIVKHTIWPSRAAAGRRDLSAFSVQRPLPQWAPEKTGAFKSDKLGRLVEFGSELELLILRQLDTDPRVVDYMEQPLTIPYVLDGEPHDYTPDAVAQLDDGRVFVIETKPRERLGDFRNWMKWASLARYCEQTGLGFWIGSPQRSLTEHANLQPDPEVSELIAAEIKLGAIACGDYSALARLVGYEQLGLAATQQLLDWRSDPGHVRPLDEEQASEAVRLWRLAGAHIV